MNFNYYKNHYESLLKKYSIPIEHTRYLEKLKSEGYEPKVIYDIGANVKHWTKEAHRIWPNAKIIFFEASPFCECLYDGYDYHIGMLSDVAGTEKKFYLNEMDPGGGSYYKQVGSVGADVCYPENKFYTMKTERLDDVVREKGYPLPDFVKMDVQGSELDIVKGGLETLKNASRMILEIPNMEYNRGAPKKDETLEYVKSIGWDCCDPAFCNNAGGYDSDYGFVNLNKK